MKTLFLISSKLFDLIKKNTFVFIVLGIGMIASNIMIIYSYGNLKQIYVADNMPLYTIFNLEDNRFDTEIFETEFSSLLYQTDYYIILDEELLANNSTEAFAFDEYFETQEHAFIRVRKNWDNFGVQKGDLRNLKKENSIILNEKMLKESDAFPVLSLSGKEFSVVGTTIANDCFMHYDNMVASGLTPVMVNIRLASMKKKEINAVISSLSERLGESFYIEKIEIDADNSDMQFSVAIIAIIYLACAMTLIYIILYILSKYAYELSIYELCGASKTKLAVILSAVLGTIILVFDIVSEIIHSLLYAPIFSKINMSADIRYSLTDYIFILIIIFLVVFVFVAFYLKSQITKSSIVNIKKFND